MRNIKIISIIICVMMLVLCACGEKSEVEIPDGHMLASGEGADYYFFVPVTWTVDITSTATSAYVSSTDPSSVSVMTWTSTNTDMTLEDWWNTFTPDFESVYDNFTVISQENMLLDGEAARSMIFTGALGENTYKFRQIAAIHDGIVYVMTYTSTEAVFDTHTEEVNAIAEHFEFK